MVGYIGWEGTLTSNNIYRYNYISVEVYFLSILVQIDKYLIKIKKVEEVLESEWSTGNGFKIFASGCEVVK